MSQLFALPSGPRSSEADIESERAFICESAFHFKPAGIPRSFHKLFPLISIYHWAVSRPSLLPLWAVFTLGMLYDLLSGVPLGLYILVFLSVYGIVVSQRRFVIGKSFLVYWLGYGTIALGAAVQSWFVASVWYASLLNIEAILFQYVISFGVFPIVAWISLRLQQAFLRQEHDASG